MNKFICIQICINEFRKENIFVLFCQNACSEIKKGGLLALILSTKSVHLRLDKSLEAFNGFYLSGNCSTYN